MFTSSKTLSRFGAMAVAATLFLSATVASAQRSENPPELSEQIASGIMPLSALYDAKKYDDAVKLLDTLMAKSGVTAYDRAFLNGYKAQLVYVKGDPNGAIEPLETMLKLADANGFYKFPRALPIAEMDALSTLAQLYMQEAQAANRSPESVKDAMAKARSYGQRMISGPKLTADAQFMWARIVYGEATLDPRSVDMKLMRKCADETAKALRLAINPKEEVYTLYLAALQQLGDYVTCADVLELLVSKFPQNKTFWPLLFQTYLALQSSNDKNKDDKNPELSAIITLERAQAVGQMTTNRDNFTLAGLYYNSQQHQHAADILEKGLRNGKIDSVQNNWELLANCYQQLGKDSRAAETYQEAIRLFPKSPTLEQMIAQVYYNTDRLDLALKHFQNAVAKGLEKPGQTLVHISYLALELKRLEEALEAAQKAVKADPNSKEATNLLKLIEESIAEREKFKNSK